MRKLCTSSYPESEKKIIFSREITHREKQTPYMGSNITSAVHNERTFLKISKKRSSAI